MTRVEFFTDAERFAAVIEPLVMRDRAGAVIVSHVLANQLASPYPEGPLLAAVVDGEQIGVAALRVPSFPMAVTVDTALGDPAGQLAVLADAVVARGERVVGF